MADTVQDPYQFYNNRYLQRQEEPLKVHSAGKLNRKVSLFPFVGKEGSEGTYLVSDRCTECDKGSNDGYLPAQLSVQDLVPQKQDGNEKIQTTGNVVIVTARDSSVLGEMKVDVASQFNPYNQVNHKFHTVLWCPILLFFMFIFCVPAVLYMRESDKAFACQDFKKAKKYGTVSTLLYIAGILFGLVFYAFLIFTGIHYTRKYCGYEV